MVHGSCTDPVLSPFTLMTQKLCTEILFSYIVFRHNFGIRLTSRGGGRSPKNSFVKGIKTEMGNYVLKTLIYLKRKWRQKHVLTKQEVWGRVLLTMKTLTCTWKALEKHDFNLLQLHILKKNKIDVCGCPYFLDTMLLFCLSFSCICNSDSLKAKGAKCTLLWSCDWTQELWDRTFLVSAA